MVAHHYDLVRRVLERQERAAQAKAEARSQAMLDMWEQRTMTATEVVSIERARPPGKLPERIAIRWLEEDRYQPATGVPYRKLFKMGDYTRWPGTGDYVLTRSRQKPALDPWGIPDPVEKPTTLRAELQADTDAWLQGI
jgi:hypothetical protein